MKKYLSLHIFSLLIVFTCCNLGAGSYSYAERYKIDISHNKLVEKIENLKKDNPEYIYNRYQDGNDQYDLFYSIYFYFKNKDAIIHCAINNKDDDKYSNILLTSVCYEKTSKTWKRLNSKDLTEEEISEIKKMFESEILDKLGKWERK
jgi:hypothetical protein